MIAFYQTATGRFAVFIKFQVNFKTVISLLPMLLGTDWNDWNMPSKQNRYIAAMKELDQNV